MTEDNNEEQRITLVVAQPNHPLRSGDIAVMRVAPDHKRKLYVVEVLNQDSYLLLKIPWWTYLWRWPYLIQDWLWNR